MTAVTPRLLTGDEFLAWEREQPDKHLFHEGHVFAMAGGPPRHSWLAAQSIGILGRQLRGRCVAHTSDLRLSLGTNHIVYADVTVVCGEHQLRQNTRDTVTNPKVVFEVVSKSTEGYDRGDKFLRYAATPSIKHIVFVKESSPLVQVYTREADGNGFDYRSYAAGAVAELSAIDAKIAIDELYDGAFEIPGEDPEADPDPDRPDD